LTRGTLGGKKRTQKTVRVGAKNLLKKNRKLIFPKYLWGVGPGRTRGSSTDLKQGGMGRGEIQHDRGTATNKTRKKN